MEKISLISRNKIMGKTHAGKSLLIVIYCHGDFEYYLLDEKLPLLSPIRKHKILTETQTILGLEEIRIFNFFIYFFFITGCATDTKIKITNYILTDNVKRYRVLKTALEINRNWSL